MVLNYGEVVRGSVAKQVAENIRAAILDGRLKIDDRLPTEEELARSFGISRPTVREALKRLAAQNLIRSRRGPAGGTFVMRPDPRALSEIITASATLLVGVGAFDIDQIITARHEAESICCRLAARHRDATDLAAMAAEIALQVDATISDEEFCASDVRFHRALVRAGRNGPLELMMHTVVEAFIPITNMIVVRLRERRQIATLHREILEALRSRDGDGASAALARLMEYIHTVYQAALAERADRQAADPPQDTTSRSDPPPPVLRGG